MSRIWQSTVLIPVLAVCLSVVAVGVSHAEIAVGIYDAAMDVHEAKKVSGGKGIGGPLANEADITVSYTGKITIDEMMKYDVFIVPPIDMNKETGSTYQPNIRAYVAAGGSVILTYFTIPTFPTICEFRGESWFWKGVLTKKWLGQAPPTLTPVGEHPVLAGIEQFEPVHKHFILSAPGKNGRVVLKDQMERAFAIVGEIGFGKVFTIGSTLGKDAAPWPKDPDMELKGPELKLILNAVRWMGETTQPDKKQSVALFQEKAKALGATLDGYDKKLPALCDQLRKLRKDAEAVKNAEAFLKDSHAKLQQIVSQQTGRIQEADDVAATLAQAVLSLLDLEPKLRSQYLERCMALLDGKRKALLEDGVPLERKFPRYPRAFYHPEASLRNVVRQSPVGLSSFLRQMREEAHANLITSAAQRYEAKAKWVPPGDLHNFFLLCELHDMAALPCYHFGILDRGWSGAEEALAGYAKYPGFVGFMIDEPKYTPYHGAWGSGNPDATMDFRKYLKNTFPRKVLQSYGVEDPDAVSISSVAEARKNQFIWSLVGQYSRETIAGWMGRDMKFVKSLDKNLMATMDLQGLGYPVWYATLAPLGGGYICCEPYDRASFKQVYISELLRGCTGGKVWKFMAPSLRYAWHNETQYRRGMYQALAHNDGIGIFLFAWVAPRMTSWSGSRKAWQPTFWPITCEMFELMEKLEDYIADTESHAQVAVLVSERSMWNNHYGAPFNQELQTIFTTLCMQNHTLTDFIFLDLLAEPKTKERLQRYKILIAPIADSMTDEEAAIIQAWVNEGGVLIAAAGTSLCDVHGIPRKDYALADVLGVKFTGWEALTAKTKTTLKEGGSLSNAVEYSPVKKAPQKYDLVSPLSGAHVQAVWETGKSAPAILTNSYGKGASVFLTAPYLALGCKPSGPFLADLVNWARTYGKTKPNLVLEGCPSHVDATVRVARAGDTLVLHLTSYRGEVSGVKAKIRTPWASTPVTVEDPINGKALEHTIDQDYVCFDVPDFQIHSMTAISRRK